MKFVKCTIVFFNTNGDVALLQIRFSPVGQNKRQVAWLFNRPIRGLIA